MSDLEVAGVPYKKLTGWEWREWAEKQIRAIETKQHDDKLQIGAENKAIFLPFLGEFGHKMMHFVRLVHFSTAKNKLVCCRDGEQVLYPSATGFITDWIDPVPDSAKVGTDRVLRDWGELLKQYPDFQPVPSGALSPDQEMMAYSPDVRIPFKPKVRGLSVDVCIGTRSRQFLAMKNWPHGQKLADALRSNGYTYAVIGSRATSYALEGQTCISGDYGDVDAAIELLRSCQLFCGQDSGGAHLATTVGADCVVWDVPDFAACTTRKFFDRMRLVNQDHQMTRITDDKWNDVDFIIETVLTQLKAKTILESRLSQSFSQITKRRKGKTI